MEKRDTQRGVFDNIVAVARGVEAGTAREAGLLSAIWQPSWGVTARANQRQHRSAAAMAIVNYDQTQAREWEQGALGKFKGGEEAEANGFCKREQLEVPRLLDSRTQRCGKSRCLRCAIRKSIEWSPKFECAGSEKEGASAGDEEGDGPQYVHDATAVAGSRDMHGEYHPTEGTVQGDIALGVGGVISSESSGAAFRSGTGRLCRRCSWGTTFRSDEVSAPSCLGRVGRHILGTPRRLGLAQVGGGQMTKSETRWGLRRLHLYA